MHSVQILNSQSVIGNPSVSEDSWSHRSVLWDGSDVFTGASAYLVVFGMDFQNMVPQSKATIHNGQATTATKP